MADGKAGTSDDFAVGLNSSLAVALAVLNKLGETQGMSDIELAASLGIDPGRVSAVLGSLASAGYIGRDEVDLYWLGPRVRVLGAHASTQNALLYASRDIVGNLVAAGATNAALYMRQGSEIYRIAYREGENNPPLLRLPPFAPASGPLYLGGASKVLLAHTAQGTLEEVISRHLNEFLPRTLRTREGVLSLLENIRRDDHYVAVAEIHPQVYTISAPVRNAGAEVIAAIDIMGLVSDLTPRTREQSIATVRDAARCLSQRLR